MTRIQPNQSVVSDYLSSIGKIAILSKDQQLIHGKAIREWLDWPDGKDKAPRVIQRRGQRSMKRMIESNLRIVVSIAKKYAGNGLALEDLIQEGNIGLMIAAEKFEPSRGYCFSTCAYWWIRQSMTRALANSSRTIRLPCNVTERIRKIRSIQDAWMQRHGCEPTAAQIAEEVGEDLDRVKQALEVITMQPRSLDELMAGHENSTLESMVSADTDLTGHRRGQEDSDEQLRQLQELMACLPELEAKVIEGVLVRGLTQGKIAQDLGENRQVISKAYRSAMEQLLTLATERGYRTADKSLTNKPARATLTNVVSKAKPSGRKRQPVRYERYYNSPITA